MESNETLSKRIESLENQRTLQETTIKNEKEATEEVLRDSNTMKREMDELQQCSERYDHILDEVEKIIFEADHMDCPLTLDFTRLKVHHRNSLLWSLLLMEFRDSIVSMSKMT